MLWHFQFAQWQLMAIAFLPLTLRLGGSIANQSLVFVQSAVLDSDIERARALSAVRSQVALLTLVVFCLVVTGYVCLRFGDFVAAVHMALPMFVVGILSLVLGVAIPYLFYRCGWHAFKSGTRFLFVLDMINTAVFVCLLR